MDALIAAAGPLKAGKGAPHHGRRKPLTSHKTVDRGSEKESIDPSTLSILGSTRLPHAFHDTPHASGSGTSSSTLRPDPSVSKIKDKKLRAKVARTDVATQRANRERNDVNEWLNAPLGGAAGGIEVDHEAGERTWRIGQGEIESAVGLSSRGKKFDLKFDGLGEYVVDYTRNGRHLAIASKLGHVATFDWQAGKLHSEIQLRETVRDIKFLQSESFYAVAQKKYVYIYDQDGVELHKLKQHIEPLHLEFLPYHYLLVSSGHAGYLKYHDVSTGTLLTQIPSRLGSPPSMTQNAHSGIIHLGHTNGTMTLWSPNMTTPHVKLLAHRGPVSCMAVDPSERSAGRYTVTGGMDGMVKLWDGRMWGKEVKSWHLRNRPQTLSFSGRGMLAIGGKGGVTVYNDLHSGSSADSVPAPYLNLPTPSLTAHSAKFCPFDDILAVGHSRGISSLLVPGSGEPNFDSGELDVFESRTRRREREVRGVLDKIRPELITLDTEFLGKVGDQDRGTYEERQGKSYRQLGRMERLALAGEGGEDSDAVAVANGETVEGVSDGDGNANESTRPIKKDKERHKARGKGTGMKKYLKKKRKNVIDPALIAMRAKVAAQRQADEQKRKIASGEVKKETGALARFG
ncbi:WD40-repeat-containing domain protein [Kockovaella imperatae]|uniref:U three protein 7 n=1 Tax=Kockovaella imperatae TaxID=4999 RepID=A0A1Y1UNI3_9TREE|nr:WD40-repeat-containing domain protein [Kockovaella imperatae]ORX39620.1 WD40-repeat-containing domain protein [Kockovaella imperatae]